MSPGILKIYTSDISCNLYLMNTVLLTLIELCPLDQWKSAEVLISIDKSSLKLQYSAEHFKMHLRMNVTSHQSLKSMSRDMLTLSKIRYTENTKQTSEFSQNHFLNFEPQIIAFQQTLADGLISTQYNKRFCILFNELKIAVPCQLLQRSYYTRPNDFKFHEIMSNSKIKTFKNLCICLKIYELVCLT